MISAASSGSAEPVTIITSEAIRCFGFLLRMRFATMAFAMAIEQLPVTAFCVYLGAWIVLGAAAIACGIPRRRDRLLPQLECQCQR